MRYFFLVLVVALGCGDSDSAQEGAAGAGGSTATELELCDAVGNCIFGAVEDDAELFAAECVTDQVFAEPSPACRGCLADLSCAHLEAAFEGDADAQAMCPGCE